MSLPIIGISSGFELDQNYLFKGYPRLMLNRDYPRSIEQAGGIPIVLPLTESYEVALEQVRAVDALLLSGGQDVNPLIYGQEPHEKLANISPERDTFETLLLQAAVELKKPIMGICRGSQIMNVYFGGTLLQDNSFKEGAYIKHAQSANPQLPIHHVNVDTDSFLGKAVGETEFLINSFHHQSIDQVAPGFKAIAVSKDGIIEGIESTSDHFMFAVQWHPEMMSRENKAAQHIFKAYVEYVKNM
ncbi:MAG: gamma-glutamyl-gamma-aminobutyrate hydrolase family protein [Culicoidibacterales bacterium]